MNQLGYEHRGQRPISRSRFLLRLVTHAIVAQVIVVVSLGAGMVGYHHYESMNWRDAYLNTTMLLGGMGPVKTELTEQGKVFAGTYALYAGLVVIAVVAIMIAPVMHRVLHRFHWAAEGEK